MKDSTNLFYAIFNDRHIEEVSGSNTFSKIENLAFGIELKGGSQINDYKAVYQGYKKVSRILDINQQRECFDNIIFYYNKCKPSTKQLDYVSTDFLVFKGWKISFLLKYRGKQQMDSYGFNYNTDKIEIKIEDPSGIIRNFFGIELSEEKKKILEGWDCIYAFSRSFTIYPKDPNVMHRSWGGWKAKITHETIIGVVLKMFEVLKILSKNRSWFEYDNKFQQNSLITKDRQEIITNEPNIITTDLTELYNLIGLDSVKKEIKALLDFVEIRKLKIENGLMVTPSTLHMVFTGNPGTGKTTVARFIGKIFKQIGLLEKGHCVEVTRTDLVGEFIGHTAPKTTKIFNKALGGVLFIDEAYSLAQDNERDFGIESINTLNKLMEDYREQVVVIVAGYTNEMKKFLQSNSGLNSRFPTKIHFDDFVNNEKIQILEKLCNDNMHKLSVGAKEKAYLLIEKYNFAHNARSIRNLFEKIIKNQAKRLKKISKPKKEQLMIFETADIPNNFTED